MSEAQNVLNHARLLPGVPLIESPFFAKLVQALGWDDETKRIALDLHTNGYAVLDFPDPAIGQKADAIKRALHGMFDWAMWHDHGHRDGISLRAWDVWTQVPDVCAIATNASVIELLSKLYGRQAWPFQTLNFPVGTQQHAHSDVVHFSSNPERFMCGVWVALEDITPDNGPLVYYPGSHKWPIYTNEHIGYCVSDHAQKPSQAIYEEMWAELIKVNQVKPEYLTCKAGQCLIWAANLLHGGSQQFDKNKTRWSQVTHYYFEDCAYFTPMWSDPFDGLVYFREPVDIVTGERRASQYAGHRVAENFIAESRSGHFAFDTELYLAANPDVAAAGMPALEHYLRHGKHEKRPLR
jgi:hypothetical protein